MKRLIDSPAARRALSAAGVLITVAFLGWLVWRERAVFVDYTWDVQWGVIALAIVPLTVALLIVAVVWSWIMRALGSQTRLLVHARIYVSTHLARRLPGTVWYVVGRGYLYQQRGESVRLATAGSGLELVVMTLSGGIVTLAIGSRLLRDVSFTYVGLLVAVVVGALILSNPRVIRRALRWVRVTETPPLHYGQIVTWVLAFSVVWVLGGLVLFLIAHGLVQTPASDLAYVVAAWTLTGTLSVLVMFLPSNFGFTEIALSVLLSAIMPSSLAVVVAVGSRVFIIVLEAVATGLCYVLLSLILRLSPRKMAESPPKYP